MAVRGQEVEVLGPGVESDSEVKGSFALNMLWRRNGWEVRKGFGQVAEMDTTLGAIDPNNPTRKWGYRNHLGSYLMKTNFGHDQIISVFSVDAYTGSTAGSVSPTAFKNALQVSQFLNAYMVSIYDLTTDDWWEEAIYAHTASFSQAADSYAEMPRWKGHYQTAWAMVGTAFSSTAVNGGGPAFDGGQVGLDSHQRWLLSEHDEDTCFFAEIDDQLFFGNQDMGLMLYSPAMFRGWRKGPNAVSRRGRSAQVDSAFDRMWKPPYSESSLVSQAVASDGAFTNAYLYLNKTEYPKPRGAAVLMSRLVVFDDKTLYFADVGRPTSVVVENTLFVPSEKSITAIEEHLGNLLVWTEDETWLFRPSNEFIATTGRLTKLADGLGCLSPGAVSKAQGAVFWVDKRGAYSMAGNLAIQKISDAIDPFFTGSMPNPITSYYTANGHASTSAVEPDDLPPINMSMDSQSVSSVYYHDLQSVIFSFPRLNMCLCYRDGKWAVWSVESIVQGQHGGTNIVGSTQNILNPWVLADKDSLYIVGSPYENQNGQPLTNQTVIRGTLNPDPSLDTTSRSVYIMRYGLGGGLDRSVETGEDRRHVVGQWMPDYGVTSIPLPSYSDHFLYVGKPIPIPPGSVLGTAAAPSDPDDSVEGAVWVPIDYVRGRNCGTGTNTFSTLSSIAVRLYFDAKNWRPITTAASLATVASFLPPERITASVAPTAWTVQRTTDAGVPSAVGDYVDISGTFLNSRGYRTWERNRLVYVPFYPLNPNCTVGMALGVFGATVNPTATGLNHLGNPCTAELRTFIWRETRLGGLQHQDNNVAQCVDWAYKSGNIETEGGVQIKGRGLNIVGTSNGPAYNDEAASGVSYRLEPNWPFGLMNIIGGADYKEWSSQVIDVIPAPDAVNTQGNTPAVILDQSMGTIRTRYKESATAALTTTTFNTANGPKYSAAGGSASEYRYIAGGEEVNQLSISDSVRGQSISYMMWGHIRNKAEGLFFQSVKVVYRVLGGKRRTGR